MSSLLSDFDASVGVRRAGGIAAENDPTWFRLWLPALLIATAVWFSHYHARFAAEASGKKTEAVDEIEEVGKTTRSRQVSFLMLGAFGGVLLLRHSGANGMHRRPLLVYKPVAFSVAMFALFLTASVVWSDSPDTTMRRLIIVYLVMIAAVAIGQTWTPIELCHVAFMISSAFLLISIVMEVRAGTFLSGGEYRFAGAFHPNRQALNCGILALSSLALCLQSRKRAYLIATGIGIVGTYLTASRGGLVALAVSLGACVWMTAASKQRVGMVLAGMLLASLALFAYSLTATHEPELYQLSKLGRTDQTAHASTLTGRVPIWLACRNAIQEQPLFGYGYGAFWTPKRVKEFSYIRDWSFSNAHSIYLETMLHIGAIGLLLAICAVVSTAVRARQLFKRTGDYGVIFILALLCMGACNGLVEAIFVSIGFESILVAIGIAVIAMYPVGGLR